MASAIWVKNGTDAYCEQKSTAPNFTHALSPKALSGRLAGGRPKATLVFVKSLIKAKKETTKESKKQQHTFITKITKATNIQNKKVRTEYEPYRRSGNTSGHDAGGRDRGKLWRYKSRSMKRAPYIYIYNANWYKWIWAKTVVLAVITSSSVRARPQMQKCPKCKQTKINDKQKDNTVGWMELGSIRITHETHSRMQTEKESGAKCWTIWKRLTECVVLGRAKLYSE